MSAQRLRPDKSCFLERQTLDLERRRTFVGKSNRSFSGTKTPTLKPSKSLSEIKNYNSKSAEKSFCMKNKEVEKYFSSTIKHKEIPKKDPKQFLKKFSVTKETPIRNSGLYSLIDPAYTGASRKDKIEKSSVKQTMPMQNKTVIDRVIAPFDPKIESSGIQV